MLFYAVSFLDAFEKLRKATISFIMSACPFVHIFGKIILNVTQTYSNADVACHDINL